MATTKRTLRSSWPHVLIVIACGFAVACSDDDGGGTDKDSGATADGASGADAGGSNDGGSSSADAATAGDAGPAGRNAKCTNFDDGVYGKKRAWAAFTHKGTTYTCNVCRGGRKDLQGTWRLVDFDTEDPRTPLKSKDGSLYRETISIDGNHWSSRLVGKDLGKAVDAKLDGYYFCSDIAEVKGEPTIFVQQTVTPEGAFGNDSKSAWGATVLHKGADRLSLTDLRFDDLSKPGKQSALYCRVGAKVKVKEKGKDIDVLCDDPFKK